MAFIVRGESIVNHDSFESVADLMQRVAHIEQARCPHCGMGASRVVATLLPQRDQPKLRGPP